MDEKNLPVKIVLPKTTDTQKNRGNGSVTFFGDVTREMQNDVIKKFEAVATFYKDVFAENEHVPVVGKIKVKPEAIAKSHKPNDLCRNLPIIGSEKLDELYIKATKKSIQETIDLINKLPSERFRANLTALQDVTPITAAEKINPELGVISEQGNFNSIKNKIKIKIFDFNDEYDDTQIITYVMQKLKQYGLEDKHELISYGKQIKLIKVEVSSYKDIIKIAEINGVKSVDFFQEYSIPSMEFSNIDIQTFLDDGENSEESIGIIDGGISIENTYLAPYVIAREEYVNEAYRNPKHATFIASTIQYGNELNSILDTNPKRYKFIDVIALPNGDPMYGPTDTIGEEELMEIIEEVMSKYSATVKVWNLSLGIKNQVCNGKMSDLGIFLDYIQDKHGVQMFVSIGNLEQQPLREWPPQADMNERDRLIAPADSVRAVSVGSVALYDSSESIVKANEPSPFSRRGPGANYVVKPDVVDFGGNIASDCTFTGLGIRGFDPDGSIIEGIGTSYSTPRIAQKFATIFDEMLDKDLLLAKAMLIHSARRSSRELLDKDQNNIKYFGFGIPSVDSRDVLSCSNNEITLVFRQKVVQGTHLEMFDFPYPISLIRNGKCFGEICMTLAYNPPLDERYGQEYCRTNIDVSFGTFKYLDDGKIKYTGCVPLESSWDARYEKNRVENGFKWSPIKSYYRKISNRGIKAEDGWKIRIDLTPRNGYNVSEQEFVLIVTIRDARESDIYSEVVNGLRERGYITNNLETRQQIRQR